MLKAAAGAYFGTTFGSPPGLPGGGITGILSPCAGGGACIFGSMSGGQIRHEFGRASR